MSYLRPFLDGKKLDSLVTKSETILKKVDFNTIAVRGNSGMLLGIPLAIKMKKKLIIIRKSVKDSHSDDLVEGWGSKQKILLVDDFIQTGATIKAMIRNIEAHCDCPDIKGIYYYAISSEFSRKRAIARDTYKNVIYSVYTNKDKVKKS